MVLSSIIRATWHWWCWILRFRFLWFWLFFLFFDRVNNCFGSSNIYYIDSFNCYNWKSYNNLLFQNKKKKIGFKKSFWLFFLFFDRVNNCFGSSNISCYIFKLKSYIMNTKGEKVEAEMVEGELFHIFEENGKYTFNYQEPGNT